MMHLISCLMPRLMFQKIMALTIAFVVVAAGPVFAAQSEPSLLIDLSQEHVDITMGFSGGQFMVHGTKGGAGDIAIVVRGPSEEMRVWRKSSVGGIWMNTEDVEFDRVPVYYDVATSRPVREMASLATLREYQIGLAAVDFFSYSDSNAEVVSRFREALVRDRQMRGFLPLEPRRITFLNDQFFRADFTVPANVPAGFYRVSAYLIDDDKVVASNMRELRVAQTGFSAAIYSFAQDYPFAYGMAAVVFALIVGWCGFFVMRRE